jgi:hypothetical protein
MRHFNTVHLTKTCLFTIHSNVIVDR